MIYCILIIVCSIVLDQLTKYLAVAHLAGNPSYPVIENVLHFTYVENRGAAFGMLANHRWIFMILSTVAIVALTVWIFWDKSARRWYHLSAALIVGGGIGNMIDRFLLGYVVDFIDVVCIDFYVFNVADSCVTVGCVLFMLGVILDEVKVWREKKAAGDNTK